MIIYNAEIFTQNRERETIANGFVRFENGRITEVGQGTPELSGECFDACGGALYRPGGVAPGSARSPEARPGGWP